MYKGKQKQMEVLIEEYAKIIKSSANYRAVSYAKKGMKKCFDALNPKIVHSESGSLEGILVAVN